MIRESDGMATADDAIAWFYGDKRVIDDRAESYLNLIVQELRRLRRVEQLARDAVEAGAIDECYLSLLRDAIGESHNTESSATARRRQP